MKRWLRRIRGALGLGLIWFAVGFGIGAVIELIHNVWPNPVGGAVDIWPAVLGYPGFLGGVAFSVVLGIVGRRRRFDQLSLPGVAGAGALGGALVALVPAAMVLVGLATPNEPVWKITAALMGPFSIGGAAAAAGTLVLARRADDRERLGVDREVEEAGLTREESRELLGG